MSQIDSYPANLRDDKSAFLNLQPMYQASLNHAYTYTDVVDEGVRNYVQRTTQYNIDPANIINDELQPRPVNPRPVLANNPTAANISLYKIQQEAYVSTATSIRVIHQKILNGLSPTAILAVDAHALLNPLILRYPYALWDFLYTMYGNYTEEQIHHFKEQLHTPISDSDTLQSHHVAFHRLVDFLASIQQPLSAVDQMAAYHRSVEHNQLYKHSQPLAARTLQQLTTYVELNAPNIAIAAPVLGYAAATTAPPPRARQPPRSTTTRRPPSPPIRRSASPAPSN
jgi:hypothetical protein